MRHVVCLFHSTVDLGLASNLALVQGLKLGCKLSRLSTDLAPTVLADGLHSLEVFFLDCVDGDILRQGDHASSVRNFSDHFVLSQKFSRSHHCQFDCAYRLQTLHANEVACELLCYAWALC